MQSSRAAVVLLSVVATLAACGGASKGSATAPAPTVKSATAAASAAPHPAHTKQPSPAHVVTAPAVQRVIIAGDSIPEDLGPMVTSTLAGPTFTGHTESHASSGLVRTDFFDWPAAAARLAAEHPTTVILMMGGNDNQPIVLPGQPFLMPASPAWETEYARRAGLVMQALKAGGVPRVYWLTMPTTTRPEMNAAIASMGRAVHAAATLRPWVTVYSTDQLLGTLAGSATAHQPDGIHLSTQGSQVVANALIIRLRADAAAHA